MAVTVRRGAAGPVVECLGKAVVSKHGMEGRGMVWLSRLGAARRGVACPVEVSPGRAVMSRRGMLRFVTVRYGAVSPDMAGIFRARIRS